MLGSVWFWIFLLILVRTSATVWLLSNFRISGRMALNHGGFRVNSTWYIYPAKMVPEWRNWYTHRTYPAPRRMLGTPNPTWFGVK